MLMDLPLISVSKLNNGLNVLTEKTIVMTMMKRTKMRRMIKHPISLCTAYIISKRLSIKQKSSVRSKTAN